MPRILRNFLLALSFAWYTGHAQEIKEHHPPPIRASFYAPKFEGRRMANGDRFHQSRITAASRVFPLGTMIRVYCPATGVTIDVEVTDRGPWGTRYQLDLSKAAFRALGVSLSRGWATVTVSRATPRVETPPKFSDEFFEKDDN